MGSQWRPVSRSQFQERGWVRYAWLVYLFMLVWQPLFDPHYGQTALIVTLASVAVFLPLYLRGYDARGKPLIAYALAIGLLGLITTPFNFGAAVYFVYASAAVGDLEPVFLAQRLVGLFTLMAVGAAFLTGAPWPNNLLYFLPTIFFVIFTGVLNIYSAERRRNLERLEAAREENQRLAVIAERERIARDLHDVLGHTLSLIVLKAELARKLSEKAPDRAAREMAEVERVAREALAQVREVVRGYRGGLADELKQAKVALESAGIQVQMPDALPALPPAYEGGLALVLREAVTNVIRHSGASRVQIRLEALPDGVRLSVEDNGRGLGAGAEGNGILGMQQRVGALGGTLLFEEGPGTRLHVVLPPVERRDRVVA